MNKSHRSSRLLAAVWIFTACLLLSGCAPATPTPPPIDFVPCNLGDLPAQCGTLTVFEDREAQSGRTIDLRVAVVKARGDNPAPDPIFWLAGGPGGVATKDASFAKVILKAANEKRDLVFVDQRGTGGSNEMRCPMTAGREGQAEALRTCLDELDSDPGAYTTAWAMDDVDDVRAALGYDKVNLYGESYGATAIQVYILRHEEHVRTATLIGGSLLDVPMFEQMPQSSQRALEGVFARCEADAYCSSTYPEFRKEFAGLTAQLAEGPITLPISDPLTGEPGLFTREMLNNGVHGMLIRAEYAALMPRLIHMAYSEDWEGVVASLPQQSGGDDSEPTWQIMNLSILCYEDWALMRRAETDKFATGSYLAYEDVRFYTVQEDICAVVPKPPASALYGKATVSNVPVLLINGEFDPQDPPDNVADALRIYPNSLSLIAPGQGHGYSGFSCREMIVAEFIERGSVKGLSVECLESVRIPGFE